MAGMNEWMMALVTTTRIIAVMTTMTSMMMTSIFLSSVNVTVIMYMYVIDVDDD